MHPECQLDGRLSTRLEAERVVSWDLVCLAGLLGLLLSENLLSLLVLCPERLRPLRVLFLLPLLRGEAELQGPE